MPGCWRTERNLGVQQIETTPRAQLDRDRDRVLHAAVTLTDNDAVEALIMRRLVRELRVVATAL
jgi:hypothetical protein